MKDLGKTNVSLCPYHLELVPSPPPPEVAAKLAVAGLDKKVMMMITFLNQYGGTADTLNVKSDKVTHSAYIWRRQQTILVFTKANEALFVFMCGNSPKPT